MKERKVETHRAVFQSLCFLKTQRHEESESESVNLPNIPIISPPSLAAVNFIINIACLLAHATLRVWALHRALDRAAADEDGSGAAAHGLALLLQSALAGVVRLRGVCFLVVGGVGVGFPVFAAGAGVHDGGGVAGLAGGGCAGVVYATARGARVCAGGGSV